MFFPSLSEWSTTNIIIRMVCALVLGCLIGLDRSVKRRVAGTKTNTIVCLGAALVMVTAQYMEVYFPGSLDMSRMASQVISGVGFLGVGTIIVSGIQVRGLTTAATLWTCACVGLAAGIGFVDGAVFTCVLMLIALHLLPVLEKITDKHSHYVSVYIELKSTRYIPAIIEHLKAENIQIDSFDITKSRIKGDPVAMMAIIHVDKARKIHGYLEEMEKLEGVNAVETL